MLTLIGCTSAAHQAQIDAGAAIGRAAAGINLGDQPSECGQDTPHAALFAGQEATTALRRERAQLDQSNASKRRCWQFNENQRAGLAGN